MCLAVVASVAREVGKRNNAEPSIISLHVCTAPRLRLDFVAEKKKIEVVKSKIF
jgi:hypothetical protein